MSNLLAAKGYEGELAASHFQDGRFYNAGALTHTQPASFFGVLWRYLTEKKVDAVPRQALPVQAVTTEQLEALSNDTMHLIKLGHSSVLLKVYGEYWLIDPVFSERASPFSFLGPKRFHSVPVAIEDLPAIDKVLISHNHYDHLDKQSIGVLKEKTAQFLVPLGVEADLELWGVEADKILSFDWWQELHTEAGLIAFTPTQHFSGRSLGDGNSTLWGSWVIKTQRESLFFSGDSGYFHGFKQIGRKYGPFDLTLIETGAYDKDWAGIHMSPEESVQAHQDLDGKVMMPIHNGTFDLAFHSWYEPLERVTKAAQLHQVNLSTPIVGQALQVANAQADNRWWREYLSSASD